MLRRGKYVWNGDKVVLRGGEWPWRPSKATWHDGEGMWSGGEAVCSDDEGPPSRAPHDDSPAKWLGSYGAKLTALSAPARMWVNA